MISTFVSLLQTQTVYCIYLIRFFDKVKTGNEQDERVGIHETSNLYQNDPFISKRFKANFRGKYKGKPLRTNDMGLRDTMYSRARIPVPFG